MAVNYLAPMRLTRAFAPVLRSNGGGAVVNINSIISLVTLPMCVTCSASKAAAHSLTLGQRAALRSQGTLVIGVYPGPIDTDLTDELDMPKASAGDVARQIIAALRIGQEDVLPDPLSRQLHGSWQVDAKATERQVAGMGG